MKDDHTQLKALQVALNKLEKDKRAAYDQKTSMDKQYQNICSLIKEKRDEVDRLSKTFIVSEHALLRYAERVMGVDFQLIKDAILTEELKSQISLLGPGKYPIKDGVAVVRGNTIITINT